MPSLFIGPTGQYINTMGPLSHVHTIDGKRHIFAKKITEEEAHKKIAEKAKRVKKTDKERPVIDAVNELKALRETISKEPKSYYTGQMTEQQKNRLGKAIEKVKATHFNSGLSDKRWYELTADA